MNVRALIFGIVALGALFGCDSTPSKVTQSTEKSSPTAIRELRTMGFSVAGPISQEGVTVIPIVSNKFDKSQGVAEHVTLSEAKANGWIKITEGNGEYYNGVMVSNTGPKPILLLAGDLLVGGHQDRVVARDVVVMPGETKNIEVFCVEKDRSDGPTDVFQPSDTTVPYQVRKEAVFGGSQEGVWSSIGSFNAAASASPPTKTVQGGLLSKSVQDYIDKNHQPMIEKIVKIPNAVGYVVIRNGQCETAEIFGSNALFKIAAPRLIRGLQATAALSPMGSSIPNDAVAAQFLVEVLSGVRNQAGLAVDDNRPGAGQGAEVFGFQAERSAHTNAPSYQNSFEIKSKTQSKGVETYSGSSDGSSAGKFLHGTYSR